MGMPTAVNLLKKKLEESGVTFSKPQDNQWMVKLDDEVIVQKERTLSQAVWAAARKLGEEV